MIKAIIIENEKRQSDYLTALLAKHFPEIELLKACSTVSDGIKAVNTLQPDLIFLDVELPPYTGFDLLEQTRTVNYEVIFTTGFNKYAVKAFRFCALDYIEKPFGQEELKEAVDRYKAVRTTGARKNIDVLLNNVKQKDLAMQSVGIPFLSGIEFIPVSDIIFCAADGTCAKFYLTNGKKLTATKTLKWVEELLKEHNFFRVHESYLINLNHIKRYKKGGEGGIVEMNGTQEEIDVARRRKDDFLKVLSALKMIHN